MDPDSRVYLCVVKNIDLFYKSVDEATKGQPDYLRKVLLDYDEVFQDVDSLPPHRDIDHKIELLPDSIPPWKNTYHMSDEELKRLKDELERLLKLGHIQRSTSPFGAPLFFVTEKMGKVRMVFDYRALNKITIKNRTALPNITKTLDQLRDARVFTKIDLQSGYYLIQMAEGHKHKTAFQTKYRHFEFLVMPFGLCNAPAMFQTFMNDIFRDLLDTCVVVYLDDILVYSRTHEEHEQHLRTVLERLKKHQLRAQRESTSAVFSKHL